jgi:glucose-6-phosphate isomerase
MPDYRRRATREAMSVRLDVNGMMADVIGEAGVKREEIEALSPRLSEVTHALRGRRAAGELPVFDLFNTKPTLTSIKDLAAEVREECETLVVLGIGGSASGARAVAEAVGESGPRLVVLDTVDPWTVGRLLDDLDLNRTVFNVISKSGETVETMALFLVVRDLLLRQLGAVDYVKRLVITTDADAGPLRQIVHDEGFRDLVMPAGVGGRFSVLTAAGLFPAAVCGVRIDDLLAGAAWMDSRCQATDVWQNPAHLLGTLLHLADTRRHQDIVALMPYSDRLRAFTAWFAQLWAESLGKAETLEGLSVHVGQTPLAAVGAADEHSLLQLFADGPLDKVVIMVRLADHGREVPAPASYADLDGIGYLGGTGLGQLLNAQQRASELTLQKRQRPTMTLTLPQLSAFTLGQLIGLFEIAVIFAAGLFHIDPFNQPGVEDSKRFTYGQLGRGGFEVARTEVEAWLAAKRKEYML